VNKISQIMPQFSKVAEPGDTVLLGLEGDPLFPFDETNRPKATIEHIDQREHDTLVTLRKEDGTKMTTSTMSLAADQVWEFDDASFQKVLDRQRKEFEAESRELKSEISDSEYEAESGLIHTLRSEIDDLRTQLAQERENTRNFHNTMIASINEMAGDICKLDKNGSSTGFCRTLTSEYGKMMEARAETEPQAEYRASESEISADETDFF
jgi:hypothetical protein